MLSDRGEALTCHRVLTVCRLQARVAELLPGQAKRDMATGQAKAIDSAGPGFRDSPITAKTGSRGFRFGGEDARGKHFPTEGGRR